MSETYHLPGAGRDLEDPYAESSAFDIAESNLLTHQLHHEATQIILSKDTSRIHKVTLLTILAINTFAALAETSQTPVIEPGNNDIRSYAELATKLSTASDPETQIDLEMLNEAVAEFTAVSPISVARLIERVEIQHQLPTVSTVAVKLWVLDRSGNRSALPSHFDNLHAQYFAVSA